MAADALAPGNTSPSAAMKSMHDKQALVFLEEGFQLP